MKAKFVVLIVSVTLVIGLRAAWGADSGAQKAAMQAVSDIFLGKNHATAMSWFAKTAVRKRGKPGSAYEQADREMKDLPPGLAVKAMHLVTQRDLANSKERDRLVKNTFAGFFEKDRLPKYIGKNTAVLVHLTQPKGDTNLWLCFVLKRVGNGYKIVYSDDN